MSQSATTIIARVKKAEIDALEKVLGAINADPAGNAYVRLTEIPHLHFACWIILRRDPKYPPCLVLEANHDGPTEAFIEGFVQHALDGLVAIYTHCADFPGGSVTAQSLVNFLNAHFRPASAFYVGCAEQTLESVQNAMATRSQIEDYLDSQEAVGMLRGMSEPDIYAGVIKNLGEVLPKPDYLPQSSYEQIIARANRNIALWILLGILLLVPLRIPEWVAQLVPRWISRILPRRVPLVIFLLFYIPVLRWHENKALHEPQPAPLGIDPHLFQAEDLYVQNHLTTLVEVRPGRFRLYTLKAVLWLIEKMARTVFITGSLGGIPTIHFARWLLIDNDRRLLFFSNYDGSWASYLGDFVDRANYGLTAVWGNTANFPPSRFLFLGGAQYFEAFKLWSREHNEYAQVWYSAYPDATVINITNAVRLRDGLTQNLSGSALTRWLRSL